MPHTAWCYAGESSQAGAAGDEDEGWTRQGRGKKSQAVTRGQASVQVCSVTVSSRFAGLQVCRHSVKL